MKDGKQQAGSRQGPRDLILGKIDRKSRAGSERRGKPPAGQGGEQGKLKREN